MSFEKDKGKLENQEELKMKSFTGFAKEVSDSFLIAFLGLVGFGNGIDLGLAGGIQK